MDVNDLHPADDYSHRFFIWHEWIQANGPLTTANVFDYFATSMFYDKQSNNQVLRMQTMHTGAPIVNEAEELKRFTGIEFALVHAQPPSLFILHKRHRLSPDEVQPLAAYFIMNNRIYQSPDVYTVLSNRLLTSLYSIQASLDILRSHRPDYTPRTGFVWPVLSPLSTEHSRVRPGDPQAPALSQTPSQSQSQLDMAAPPPPNQPVFDSQTQTDPPKQTRTQTQLQSQSLGQSSTQPLAPKKKRTNDWLLYNAMKTTALHSRRAYTAASAVASETASVSTLPSTTAVGNLSRTGSVPASVTGDAPASTSGAISSSAGITHEPQDAERPPTRGSVARSSATPAPPPPNSAMTGTVGRSSTPGVRASTTPGIQESPGAGFMKASAVGTGSVGVGPNVGGVTASAGGPIKGVPGGGKKKRKRTALATPGAPPTFGS